MIKFHETIGAGRRAEQEVIDVLRRYTRHVYNSVRVDTLLTKKGDTEIDVLAAIADVILVVEVKNVRKIDGELKNTFWSLEGMETGQRYSTLNVLMQNRIHLRSFRNAWQSRHGKAPGIISTIVVPNGCQVCESLQSCGILTVHEFSQQIAEIASHNIKCLHGYALDYLVKEGHGHINRPDFVGGNNG